MHSVNPFFHRGGPIRDPAHFFGRQREIAQSLDLLRNAQSISFVGPRRIGKTSVLFHLINPQVFGSYGLSREHFCCIYIDCASLGQVAAGDLYAQLLDELREVLTASGQPINIPSCPSTSISYRAFEQSIRVVVRHGIQIAFFLDEFDALSTNPELDADFFSGLRGLAMRHGVMYVTASTEPLHTLTYVHANTLSSPFFNFFAQVRLGLFQITEAQAFFASQAVRAGLTCDADTLAWLVDLAGPHPLLLQIAGYHMFDRWVYQEPASDEVTRAWVEQRFTTEAEPHWDYAWRKLSAHDQEVLALLPTAEEWDPQTVQQLERLALVVRCNGAAVPFSRAFRAFIRQQGSLDLLQTSLLILDRKQQMVLLRGQRIKLPPVEFRLLACLIEQRGHVVAHEELERAVWQDKQTVIDPERLKTAIRALRQALGDAGTCIQNIRGVGYKYIDEPPEPSP